MLALLAALVLRSAPIAVTPDGARVVVVNADSASISVLDRLAVDGWRLAREITTCAKPQTVSVNDEQAWVACGEGRVVRIDLATMQVIARATIGIEPFGIVATNDELFVSDHGDAAIHVLDAQTLERRASIDVAAYPRGLALHDGRLLVTHMRNGDITEIDVASRAVTRVFSTGAETTLSQSIFINNGRAYLPLTRTNTTNRAIRFDTTVFPAVAILDVATGEHIKRDRFAIDAIDQPSNMPLDVGITRSNRMYVVNAGSDDVSVIDIAKRTKLAHIAVGANPRGIALTPDDAFAFVTNALDGTVSMIDTATNRVVATIAVTSIPLAPQLLRQSAVQLRRNNCAGEGSLDLVRNLPFRRRDRWAHMVLSGRTAQHPGAVRHRRNDTTPLVRRSR